MVVTVTRAFISSTCVRYVALPTSLYIDILTLKRVTLNADAVMVPDDTAPNRVAVRTSLGGWSHLSGVSGTAVVDRSASNGNYFPVRLCCNLDASVLQRSSNLRSNCDRFPLEPSKDAPADSCMCGELELLVYPYAVT